MIRYDEVKHVHLELSNVCNLRCPNCPRNYNDATLPWLELNSLTLSDIQKIFDTTFVSQLNSILLCGNFGDPMACPEIVDIVEYFTTSNRDISISIHTNGALRNLETWRKLSSVLNTNSKVVFSIDGLKDTNHIYRRGSKWDKLMENASTYIEEGGVAVWEFLKFKHNKHQVDEARQLSQELGFTDFIVKNPHGFNDSGAMHVLNENRDLLYTIYDADLNEDDNKAYQKIPITPITEAHTEYTDTEYVDKNKHRWLEEHDCGSNTVSCIAKTNREIYIDAHGNVHPCCFLGHISDFADGSLVAQYNNWLLNRVTMHDINALTRPLKEIIDDKNYMTEIEKSWTETDADSCIMQCKIICKSNDSLLGKIYGTAFINKSPQ